MKGSALPSDVGKGGVSWVQFPPLPSQGRDCNAEGVHMSSEEQRHVEAQIRRLRADAERHRAISEELEAQADRMEADLRDAG